VLSHPHSKLPLGDFYVTTAVFQASEYMHCALRIIGSLNSHLGIQVISVCSSSFKRHRLKLYHIAATIMLVISCP